ncbi:MAG: hypothetical protein RLZZ387_5224 [Chloroflexota bacterium]|jgi:hypothetical protein
MSSAQPTRGIVPAPGLGRTAGLVAGDVAAFLVFSAVGRSSHGAAAGLDALLQVAGTAAPFAVGWFLVAPFVGVFGPAAVSGVRPMVARTALAWLLAWPIGLALRALLLQRSVPLSFALVTLVTVLVILVVWRGVFALAASRTAGENSN